MFMEVTKNCYRPLRGDREKSLEAASILKKAKKEMRLQDWEKKALHDQYLKQTKE